MDFNDLAPLKLLINLDSRPDRWRTCIEDELPATRFKNVQRMPGRVIDITHQRNIDGAIGCLFAHLDCLHKALDEKKNVLIMEDDIHFKKYDDLFYLKALLYEMARTLPKDWKMAYLGGNILKNHYQVNDYWSRLQHCQSTVCYLVKYSFIETLLSYIPTDRFVAPIDVIYADGVIPRHECYMSIPMLVTQRKDVSDIEGVEVDYEQYLQKRYNDNLIKLSK